MPRQILPEEPEQEEQDSQQTPVTEARVLDFANTTVGGSGTTNTNGESTIITSHEMEKLLHEWTASGQNDLCINPTLAERIQQYLNYQEQLDPLREKLAERIYKPYLVKISENTNYKNFDIYVNDREPFSASCYVYDNYFKIIPLCDFKSILLGIGNPYAPYINVSKILYVDVLAYVIANGGSYNFDNGYHITL